MSTRESVQLTVIEPRTGWIAVNWHELADSRELLYFLIWRDIAVRYKQTVLGVAWAVLQPVFSMLIFTLIFGRFAKMPSDGHPYAVFVYAGLLPWMFFSNAVTGASQSLLNQQALLTKIYLPRLFIPTASIGSGLVDFAISFGVFLCLMLVYGVAPGTGLLAVPVLMLLTAMASLGVGLVLAAVIVTYRDFRYVIPFLVQVWMYLSPVVYSVSIVPAGWRELLALNPMVGIIAAFRSALLNEAWDVPTLIVSTASSAALLTYGLFFFRKTERRFADIA